MSSPGINPVLAATAAPARPGMFSPLRRSRLFRVVWFANMVSGLGTLIQGVGAAWMMTTLSGTPDMVALIQSATQAPILVFALFAGALADTFDRRNVLIVAQLWTAITSFALAILGIFHLIDPFLLLAFTFAVGAGNALNGPAWQAAVREIVGPDDLAAAVTLNSIGFNIARAVGPALGGLLVAGFGAETAFFVNAVSSLFMMAAVLSWRREVRKDDLPRERLGHAIVGGIRYVIETPPLRITLARGGVFGLLAASVLALLPLVARDQLGGGAFLYGILLGAFGIGALCGAFVIHSLRMRKGSEFVVFTLSTAFGIALLCLAAFPVTGVALVALAVCGAVWLGSFSTLNIVVQMTTAPWVQARVLAMYQTIVFGLMALGSWLWGALADQYGLGAAHFVAGAGTLLSLVLHWILPLPSGEAPDLRPMTGVRDDPTPRLKFHFAEGPVLVLIEYRVPPSNRGLFCDAMERVGHLRKRDGARLWNLYQDTADGLRWYEAFTLESWFEYLRQRRRGTAADEAVFLSARALLDPEFQPIVRRMIHRNAGGETDLGPVESGDALR